MHSQKKNFTITATTSKKNEQLLALFQASKKKFKAQYKKYCSQPSTSKVFYFLIIQKLKEAIFANKSDEFEKFCDIIEYVSIKDTSTHSHQRDPGNPLMGTNLVILACKFNRPEILKLLFGKWCKTLNILSATEVLQLDYADEECHNALYYAIRSNNINLLSTFFEKCPYTTYASNSQKFDKIFSQAYEELNLKRVPLSNEMQLFILSKLVGLRFLSENSEQAENAKNNLENIIKRIELVIENIFLLSAEYSHSDVDEKFLLIAKFITRNIHLLKRQLKSTYRRLPWEEIEFCLICFISSQEKQEDLNFLYILNMNKSRMLNHLTNFAQKLKDERFAEVYIDICKLAELPNINRNQVIQEIIQISPEFESLYNDYRKVRDVSSLEKLNLYLTLAVSANSEEREGHLTIARTLQVMGEYLKNTLESPKLSSTLSELLLSSLPRNTRKIIINLRNALSHSYSLARRTEIEEKSDSAFFAGIQKDMEVLERKVFYFLHCSRIECMELFLRKFSTAESPEDLQEILKAVSDQNFQQALQQNPVIEKSINLNTLMEDLRNCVSDQTDFERKVFQDIKTLLAPTNDLSKTVMSSQLMKLNAAMSTIDILKNEKCDSNLFRRLQLSANTLLKTFNLEIDPRVFKAAVQRSLFIFNNVKSRVEDEKFDEMQRLESELFYLAEISINDIKCIEKFREHLSGKNFSFSTDTQELTMKFSKLKHIDSLTSKISELRSILNSNGFGGETIENISFLKRKQLQPVIEMLVLDVMSILVYSKKCSENNTFFLDDYVPLLTGKCLRDHLAHYNAVLDFLPHDPYLAVILNAKKLVSIGNLINGTKKIGKIMRDDPFTLSDKHHQLLDIITNQKKMFSALVKGNLELLKNCAEEGSDIHARSSNLSTAVHFACMGSNLKVLKFTLKHNLSPNTRNADGQTGLHVAAEHGNPNIVQFLLKEAGLDVNDIDKFKRTPLHLAAKNGHLDIVRGLLRNNANIFAKDSRGFCAFHQAVRNDHIKVVKFLLEKERNVNINEEVLYGNTVLHYAAAGGSLNLVTLLLRSEANVNARYDYGETPIYAAALNGHLSVTKALIQNRAHVNFINIHGQTSLHVAVIAGHEAIVRILLNHGADPNMYDRESGFAPLHYAAQRESNGILSALLEHRGDANMPTLNGDTALILAAKSAPLEIVATLLKHGVDVQARNNKKYTPLHYASLRGHEEIAKLLIRSGIDVNSKNAVGGTPLGAAAASGHSDLVNLLIKYKAKVNIQNAAGNTPLINAAEVGNISIINVLLKNKAEVNCRNNDGMTAIHAAALSGCENAVTLLLSNNADINIKENNGVWPLQTAIYEGHLNIVKFLSELSHINAAEFFKETAALHFAIQAGNKEIAEFLLANGADVNLKIKGDTPLTLAVELNRLEIVELLIANGANVNEYNCKALCRSILLGFKDLFETLLKNGADINKTFFDENFSALHLAAEKGDERMVNSLIIEGAEVDALSTKGYTPLFVASMRGNIEVVRALIAKKANVNIVNLIGTPLHVAVHGGHLKVVEILSNNGAKSDVKALREAIDVGEFKIAQILLKQNEIDVNFRDGCGQTFLHFAALKNNVKLVTLLVDNGFDMNVTDDSGAKPVHCAASKDRKETVKYFLNKGLNIHEIDAIGQTPLHYAAAKGSIEVLNYLIACGANINFEDFDGLTPIHVAAQSNRSESVKILLKNGASYCATDKFKKKPLQFSSNEGVQSLLISTDKLFDSLKQNNLQEVSTLIKAGACIDAKHPKFGNPLHYAVWKGYNDIVDCLLENHANPNVVTEKGFTPLHYAAKYSRSKSVISLLHYGAVYNLAPNDDQTPLYFSKESRITWLLKMIDQAFRNVKKGNIQVISDLGKLTDKGIVKAVMRACNKENYTLVVAAIHNKYPQVKQLKEIFQGNVSIELAGRLIYYQNGIFDQCESMLKSLLENRKDILGEDNPGTLDVQVHIAELKSQQRHFEEAMNILNYVHKKQVEMLGTINHDTLFTRRVIASLLLQMGKFKESLIIFQDIYDIRIKILGPSHDDTLDALFGVASACASLGDNEKAFCYFKTIFELRKKNLGENHVLTLYSKNSMASVLTNQGKLEEGLQIFQEVHAVRKIILGIHHPQTLESLKSIGKIYESQGKHRHALNIFEGTFNIQKNMLGPNHPDTLRSQATVAKALSDQFKFNAALKIYEEVLERSKALYGPNHPDVKAVSNDITDIHWRLKMEGVEATEALPHLHKDIYAAASEGDLKTVQQLLQAGIAVNDKDTDGRVPLHYSVNNSRCNVVKFLLNNGADPTVTTKKGNTPLHTAVAKGDTAIVEILFEHIAEDQVNNFINCRTTDGGTSALHIAARNGILDITKSLLNHGAKYNIKNKENKAPLDLSTNQNVSSFLRVIDDLFEDAVKGSPEIVRKLKVMDVNNFKIVTNAHNHLGKTLFQVALTKKHKYIIRQLLGMYCSIAVQRSHASF